MKDKIKELLDCPEWDQQKLAIALNVSLHTVKSWTRTVGANNPNKWIIPALDKLFRKAGIE